MHFSTLLSSALLVASASAHGTSDAKAAAAACKTLTKLLPDRVLLPDTAAYAAVNTDYYDLASVRQPTCMFQPRSAADVAKALKVLTAAKSKFAVKAAGHMAGFNAITDGVLISLAGMKTMTWADDDSVLSIGPGLEWGEVYPEVDKKGKIVIGGRVTSVGVSGLLLGGGISLASGEFGFACDNVRGYEVVLASGEVVYASEHSHADLYRALRGGSSNFGIVTRFDLDTHAVSNTWGGFAYAPSNATVFSQVADYVATGATEDLHSGAVAATVLTQDGTALVVATLWDAVPPADGSTPPVFKDLTALPGKFGAMTMGDIVTGSSAGGALKGLMRNSFITGTLRLSRPAVLAIQDIFEAEVAALASIDGALATVAFQPITLAQLAASRRRGGNVLGLDDRKEPLLVLEASFGWTKAEDDATVVEVQQRIMKNVLKWGEEQGQSDAWLYLNDAGPRFGQKVIESYGKEAGRFLGKVKKQYDPEGVFTTLMPGGFKLPAASKKGGKKGYE
ncbi:hypothetical protein EDC01DRAFT_41991 [Geopyxis carbonaria]|nr:hypothetical protein EDC01DRAFT_41991 [Geopyxis carbonaria]